MRRLIFLFSFLFISTLGSFGQNCLIFPQQQPDGRLIIKRGVNLIVEHVCPEFSDYSLRLYEIPGGRLMDHIYVSEKTLTLRIPYRPSVYLLIIEYDGVLYEKKITFI